ncbi:MAG: ABC transporter permease [Candidatus Acidiferrum sp.]
MHNHDPFDAIKKVRRPTLNARLWRRLLAFFHRDDFEREMAEEMNAHLEMAIEENVRAGMTLREARRQALISLGGVQQSKELARDARVIPWLESLRGDVKFGWRQLGKSKVTTVAAILSLALAIGSCVAAFRLLDAVFFRPLPIAHAHQLYALTRQGIGPDGKPQDFDGWAYPDYQLMRTAAGKQADVLAISYSEYVDLTFKADQDIEKAQLQFVSGNVFPVFGLQPALGRLLSENDDTTPGAHPVAVISYDYWLRRFQKSPEVLGKRFRLGNDFFQIVGVAPESFVGTEPGNMIDIYVPTMMNPDVTRKDSTWHRTFVMLHPDTRIEPLRGKLDGTSRAFETERAEGFINETPQEITNEINQTLTLHSAESGFSDLQRDNHGSLGSLGALVLLVLLIACVNVANLMVAQAAARAREMALRVSIGAGRRHLVQLVLVESGILALLSSILGGIFAWWAAPFFISMIYPSEHPVRLPLPIDARVFLFGFGLAVVVTFLFGLIPAFRAYTVHPASVLKGEEKPHTRGRLMYGLIAAQVAFCCLVLFVAGLFVTTFQHLSHQALGFSTNRLLVVDVVTPHPVEPVFWEQVSEHLQSVPGVERVSVSNRPLLSGYSNNNSVSVNGLPPSDILGYFLHVSPGWLDTMKIPLVRGRDFLPTETAPGAAIVSESFVKAFFQGEDPLGKSFDEVMDEGPRLHYQVVGVVRDTRYRAVREDVLPTAYLPFNSVNATTGAPRPQGRASFIVRTVTRNPLALAATLRFEIANARSDFRVSRIRTQLELAQMQTVRERMMAALASFFSFVALFLAAIGLYGVLRYSVLQRRREIAIRMAVGAQPANIARLVSLPMVWTVLFGGCAGLGAGLFLSRYIAELLYQVQATDVGMLVFPPLAILGAACVASLPAVLRATRIDPTVALHCE